MPSGAREQVTITNAHILRPKRKQRHRRRQRQPFENTQKIVSNGKCSAFLFLPDRVWDNVIRPPPADQIRDQMLVLVLRSLWSVGAHAFQRFLCIAFASRMTKKLPDTSRRFLACIAIRVAFTYIHAHTHARMKNRSFSCETARLILTKNITWLKGVVRVDVLCVAGGPSPCVQRRGLSL